MNGTERFEFYLLQLEKLLEQAAKENNPGEWLYMNNARTLFFMLEGLSKLYSNLHDKTIFSKLRDRFKVLEDALGDIDHSDAMTKNFSQAPVAMISLFEKNKKRDLKKLNELLESEKWNTERITRIRKKLNEVKWLSPSEEISAMGNYYKKSVTKINEFYKQEGPVFTELEEQVHELRRKLRWLSIYPQALNGLIQLKDSHVTDENVSKYFEPAIVNSPFNKLPPQGDNAEVMLLEKNYFLALSWLISELGKLKDAGLVIIAGKEATEQTNTPPDDQSILTATGNNTLESILSRASSITADYFKEQNLEKMLINLQISKFEN